MQIPLQMSSSESLLLCLLGWGGKQSLGSGSRTAPPRMT